MPLFGSDDLLVPEEVLEVCDLEVGGDKHDDEGDDTESNDTALDLLVLILEALFGEDERRELSSQLLHHVGNLGSLKLNRAQVLLSDDVGIVKGLDAGLDREGVAHILFRVHILHANLVVAGVVGCEVVSHLFGVVHRLDFLALRISDRQDQIFALGVHFHHGLDGLADVLEVALGTTGWDDRGEVETLSMCEHRHRKCAGEQSKEFRHF
mmetsp:Transcript_11789/g.14962  ORF Transcript_11789/g.14962 Transcript_11789/m.14962 type:complete len:210 (-) Transcript_11789:7-636(-)